MLPYILVMALVAASPAGWFGASVSLNGRKFRCEKFYSNVKGREGERLTLSIGIQLADHDIGRVAHNRTANAGNVPGQKTDPRLLQLRVRLLRLAKRVIDVRHRRLERGELDHRVGDLAAPERHDPLVQTPDAFLVHHLAPSLPQGMGEGRQRGLHPDLDGLERAEGDVGEELGRGAGGEVYGGRVGGGGGGEELGAVVVFEDLVEAVLAHALEGVAEQGRGPAEEDAGQAFGGVDGAPGRDVGGVEGGGDLAAAFYLWGKGGR